MIKPSTQTITFTLLILAQLIIETLSESSSKEPSVPKTKPTLHYFIFTEQCYHTLITQGNLFDVHCLKITISKLLGYGIIAGSTFVKFPQILKIIEKKSTFGVSFESVFLEEITQISAVAYSIFKNNPFSTYGQTVFLAISMMIIHSLFIILDSNNRTKSIFLFSLIIGFFIIACFPEWNLLPSYFFQNMLVLQMILLAAARLTQIVEIHRLKSTGSLSIITFGLSAIGNLARVGTALVQVKGDVMFLLSFVLGLLLNSYIVFCFFLFKENKETKETKEAKEEKDKKET